MAVVPSFFGILAFVLPFGGFSLPLGLPPLPEDPVISRAAPEQCLAYVSWAGTAAPDSKSANQTEQLLAEPEVQKLISAIDNAITTGIRKTARPGSEEAEILKIVYPLAKTLLTRPAAVFLSKLEVSPHGPPSLQGGAVFSLAEKAAAVGESLDRLEKLLPPGAVETVELGGAPFHRIKPVPTMPVTWGIHNKCLIVGVGEGVVEGSLQRIQGSEATPAAWLVAIRKQMPVDRLSTLSYVNVKQVVAQFVPLGGMKLKKVLDATGLKNVSYLASLTGLDDKGTVARSLIATEGEPQGILRLAAGRPLEAANLSPVPRDATIAAVARFDVNSALELLLAQSEKIDPSARANIRRGIDEIERALDIDLQEDLLKPLGDVWCVYNSPGEGGLLVTGLTGVVEVKDHDRLEATLNKLITFYHDRIEAEAQARGGPRIVKTALAGRTIYHFDIAEHDFPLAPAWCLTDKELLVSTFPQNIKAYLSRGKDFQSLAAAPEVAGALGQGTVALSYCDTRKVGEFAYPLLCIGSRLLTSQLNREGVLLDSSLLPSAASIFPHLQSSVAVVRRSPAGIEFESHGSLAGLGPAPMLPVATVAMYFARTRALEQAQMQAIMAERAARAVGQAQAPLAKAEQPRMFPGTRDRTMNNLKQIALAVHNYNATYTAFPPAYIADKATGKPLLSWRVAILPFLEQEALYRQFHLDEPWDSEHNKKLIARIPPTYQSIHNVGRKLLPGETRYLTLRHKESVFPGKDGIRMTDITDGTVFTIMVVEADDAHAVTWTKPEDLNFDPAKPAAGLTGQPGHGFNAAMCDGSVHFIRDTIDLETLRNLVNRHDGNFVNANEF